MASALSLSFVLLAGLCAVYGEPATIEEFPSAVQVSLGGNLLNVQICAGTIITNRHIVSAARCFAGPLFDRRTRAIRAGATRRGFGGTVYRVEAVANHPSFGGNEHDGDISVVRVADFFVFDATVQTSSIVSQGFTMPASLSVVHAGWGRTAQDTLLPNFSLNSLEMQVISQDNCQASYDVLPFPVTITENMMCAGVTEDGGINVDPRDGGGSVFYDDVLIGVISVGTPLLEAFPLIATNVGSYSDWIVSSAV